MSWGISPQVSWGGRGIFSQGWGVVGGGGVTRQEAPSYPVEPKKGCLFRTFDPILYEHTYYDK